MDNITEIATRMKSDVEANGHKGKLYNNDGGTEVQRFNRATIQNSVGAIANSLRNDTRDKVDLYNIEDVKERAYNYVVACQQVGLLPGMSGLAGYAFKCSRAWISKFKHENPHHETTAFLDTISEMFADAISNAGLAGAANNVMSIFLLKNGYGYSDRVEIEPIIDREPVRELTVEEIEERYLI